MPTVSLSFLLALGGIAAVSGAFSVAVPNPVFSAVALILGLYAVHGLGLRMLLREQGDPREIQRQVDDLQGELEHERARLEAEREERSAQEGQWIGLMAGEGH